MSVERRRRWKGLAVLAGGIALAAGSSTLGLLKVQQPEAATASPPSASEVAAPAPAPATASGGESAPVTSAAPLDGAEAPRPAPASSAQRPSRAAATAVRPVAASATRPFAADSPWNTPIPAGAAVDPQSDAISRAVLTDRDLVMNVETYSYAVPFYTADASTPRVRLHGRADHGGLVPIDPSWRPNVGGDHKMNVLDPATSKVYELQGYDARSRSAYWMVVRDFVTGSGDGRSVDGRSGPTGAGVSQAAGTIRIADVRRGRIDHALAFVTSAPLKGRYRYPAT